MPALKVTVSEATRAALISTSADMGCTTENEMAALWLTLAARIPAPKQFEALGKVSDYAAKTRPARGIPAP